MRSYLSTAKLVQPKQQSARIIEESGDIAADRGLSLAGIMKWGWSGSACWMVFAVRSILPALFFV